MNCSDPPDWDDDEYAADGMLRESYSKCSLCGEPMPADESPVLDLAGVARYVCGACLDLAVSWREARRKR